MNQPQAGLKFLTCLMHSKVKGGIFCLQFQLQRSVELDCCVEKRENILYAQTFNV